MASFQQPETIGTFGTFQTLRQRLSHSYMKRMTPKPAPHVLLEYIE